MLYAYQVIHFNLRPREEGDNVIVILLTDSKISIHALVKRATIFVYTIGVQVYNFNPRPHEEGDLATALGISKDVTFQSTPS